MNSPTPIPAKRLALNSIARCDCPTTGALVKVLHYEGDYVQVRSLQRVISYTTPAARLWPA